MNNSFHPCGLLKETQSIISLQPTNHWLEGHDVPAIMGSFPEVDDTAHLVAYLIRGEAPARGFGVVLAYKGSTNSVDWKVNMDSTSGQGFKCYW